MLCINCHSFTLFFFLSLFFQFSVGQVMTFCNRLYHSCKSGPLCRSELVDPQENISNKPLAAIVVNNTLLVDGGELRQLNVSSGGVVASIRMLIRISLSSFDSTMLVPLSLELYHQILVLNMKNLVYSQLHHSQDNRFARLIKAVEQRGPTKLEPYLKEWERLHSRSPNAQWWCHFLKRFKHLAVRWRRQSC